MSHLKLKLLKIILKDQPIHYELSAYSQALGRVYEEGETAGDSKFDATKIREQMESVRRNAKELGEYIEFDLEGAVTQRIPESQRKIQDQVLLTNLKIKTTANGNLAISFDLANEFFENGKVENTIILLELYRRRNLQWYEFFTEEWKLLAQKPLIDPAFLVAPGTQTLVLDPSDETHPLHTFVSLLIKNRTNSKGELNRFKLVAKTSFNRGLNTRLPKEFKFKLEAE